MPKPSLTEILLAEHGVSDEVRRSCADTLRRMLDHWRGKFDAVDSGLQKDVNISAAEDVFVDQYGNKRFH